MPPGNFGDAGLFLLPPLEHGEKFAHHFSRLLLTHARICGCHMRKTNPDHFLHRDICCKCPIFITIFAVVPAFASIPVCSVHLCCCAHRHAAALAISCFHFLPLGVCDDGTAHLCAAEGAISRPSASLPSDRRKRPPLRMLRKKIITGSNLAWTYRNPENILPFVAPCANFPEVSYIITGLKYGF